MVYGQFQEEGLFQDTDVPENITVFLKNIKILKHMKFS